jgi:predicted aldo/keto reductase-like oxidoreductase
MTNDSSRRSFLAAGLALPAAAQVKSLSLAPQASAASPKFEYRVLGKTGVKLTRVSFGCMITSDPTVIERAADIGVIHFDTARVYGGGNNERMVGAALKGRRDKVILSSKTKGETKDVALRDLDKSLTELQTDHLDIWYLHDKRAAADIKDELLEAQRIAKQQGKIRFAGISTHIGHKELLPAVVKARAFDVLLTSYNFTMGNTIDNELKMVHDAGIGIVGMKVMAGGGRVMPFYPTTEETRATLKKPGAVLASLKWVLRNRNIDTVIPSMVDVDQLEENLTAMATPWRPADEKLLAETLDQITPAQCRMCGQCNGACPKGLPVSDILRYAMYADGYGQFALGRENFLQLDQSVRAVRCGDCDSCSVQCPNGVRVSDRLIRAQELFA